MFAEILYFYRFPQELINLNSAAIQMHARADESNQSQETSFVYELGDYETLDTLLLRL